MTDPKGRCCRYGARWYEPGTGPREIEKRSWGCLLCVFFPSAQISTAFNSISACSIALWRVHSMHLVPVPLWLVCLSGPRPNTSGCCSQTRQLWIVKDFVHRLAHSHINTCTGPDFDEHRIEIRDTGMQEASLRTLSKSNYAFGRIRQ